MTVSEQRMKFGKIKTMMARNKQTARKSTGGKAPRKTRATPAPPVARPVPTGVFLRDFVKKSREKSKT